MSETNSWIVEERQRHAIAERCAAGLVEHLPDDWVRCDPNEYVVTIASDDRRLVVRPERTGTLWRVVIATGLPDGYREHTRIEPSQTSVAADRPPAHIAGQVRRRLLTPEYDADIQAVHAALAAERDRKAALAVALAEIEAFLPGAGPYPHDGEGYTRFTGPDLLRGSFRFTHKATKVDIKLDWVPADLARDIAALIGKHLSAYTASSTEE
ncbi:hypothetical protein [Glycomyces sp. NPDC048151]|uniref:hypothetical protein n=1 Tax=Glycomyces sp. NPDC048151 TaxID=3364002 RepID=UPI003721011C